MKEKGLLIYEKKEGLLDEDPLSGVDKRLFEHLEDILAEIGKIKEDE